MFIFQEFSPSFPILMNHWRKNSHLGHIPWTYNWRESLQQSSAPAVHLISSCHAACCLSMGAAPSDSVICCCLHLAMLWTPHITVEGRFHLKQVSGNAWDTMLMQTNQYAIKYLYRLSTAVWKKRIPQELIFTGCFCIHYRTPIIPPPLSPPLSKMLPERLEQKQRRVVFRCSHFPFSCKCFPLAEPNRKTTGRVFWEI